MVRCTARDAHDGQGIELDAPFGGAEDELAESIQDGQHSSDEPRLEIANQILIPTRPIHEQRLGHELHHAFLAPWIKSCAV